MNDFQKSELVGRKKLKKFLVSFGATDIQFTEGDYDRIDCFFTKEGKRVGVEIKDRSPKI